jgi:hypothetical protein
MYQVHPPRRRGPGGGEFETDCGGGVLANGNASCPFAQNVREQYRSANPKGGASAAESWTIDVWSPVTKQSYTMTCVREAGGVTCRGGNDAAVWFPID